MERKEWKGWRTTVCLMLVSCVVALAASADERKVFSVADDGICSSASAVKFGTASHGGFRNVTIDNIEVYDTFRSAIAVETVDGGGLENVRARNPATCATFTSAR